MPALLAPVLLSLVVSTDMTYSWLAGARVEARARQLRPPAGENVTTGEVEVEPGVGLEGLSPTLQLDLAYAPRLTHVGGDGPDSDNWLQRAWASASWRPDTGWQVQANAAATSGVVDLFRVATGPGQGGEPPPIGQAAPVATLLDYRRFEVALGAERRLDPRLELRTRVDLLREGGADAVERETLPLQQAALLRGELAWRQSPRTILSGLLAAGETHYFDVAVAGSPQPQSWSIRTVRAEAIWRYALTTRSQGWAGAGPVLVDSGAPSSGAAAWKPFAEVGLERQGGPDWPQLSGWVVAAAAPIEDRLAGTVAQRAELRGWGVWSPSERWTLGASVMAARVMELTTEGEAFSAGEFWLSRSVRDVLLLTAGGRWTTRWPALAPGRSGVPESQWVAYLSVLAVYRSAERPMAEGRLEALGRPATARRPAAVGWPGF